MKKGRLLHGEISWLIAEMAHADTILIGDAGMPVPPGVPLIDLALTKGMVPFIDALEIVLSELEVETAYIDEESKEFSPEKRQEILDIINDEFEVVSLPHDEIKEMSKSCKAVIRTGEFTPYANIILKAGVLF